jgi:hypothetical protein
MGAQRRSSGREIDHATKWRRYEPETDPLKWPDALELAPRVLLEKARVEDPREAQCPQLSARMPPEGSGRHGMPDARLRRTRVITKPRFRAARSLFSGAGHTVGMDVGRPWNESRNINDVAARQ